MLLQCCCSVVVTFLLEVLLQCCCSVAVIVLLGRLRLCLELFLGV